MSDSRWRAVPRWHGIPAAAVGWGADHLGRVRNTEGVVIEPALDGDGYPRVRVGGRWVPVHVLVALAWHGRPEVLHTDSDRTNSKPSNLRWRSHRENERDKRRKGRKEIDGSEGYRPFQAVSPVAGGQQR